MECLCPSQTLYRQIFSMSPFGKFGKPIAIATTTLEFIDEFNVKNHTT